MSNRWNQLADEFVARARLELRTLLESMDASARREFLGPGEDAEPSPAFVAEYLTTIICDSGATPGDRTALQHLSSEDSEALRSLIFDPIRRHFVKELIKEARYAPRELTFALTRAAVYTVDPSLNKHFVMHSQRTDPDGVCKALAWFLEHGNAWEVAGAWNALYWCGSCFSEMEADELERHRRAILQRFIDDDDLDLRRSLVSSIEWDPRCYQHDASKLLNAARRIASKHEDEYVRQRFRFDTGKSKLIPPLPRRRPEPPAPTDVT